MSDEIENRKQKQEEFEQQLDNAEKNKRAQQVEQTQKATGFLSLLKSEMKRLNKDTTVSTKEEMMKNIIEPKLGQDKID